jgi:hypothetical protein
MIPLNHDSSEPGSEKNSPDSKETLSMQQQSELSRIGQQLLDLLPIDRDTVTVIPLASKVRIEDIRQHVPTGPVVVCDLYIEGFEQADPIPGGFRNVAEGIER